MKRETYIKMTQPLRDNAKLAKSLHIINKLLTGAVFLTYPFLLGWYLWNRNPDLARAMIVPLDGFIILSVFRYMVNRPRPYEKFEVAPVIPKDTKGKSFPSRHVFSAVVIGMTFLLWSPFTVIGIAILIISAGLAIVRVISGVHYISDVIAGAAWGMFCAVLGYLIF